MAGRGHSSWQSVRQGQSTTVGASGSGNPASWQKQLLSPWELLCNPALGNLSSWAAQPLSTWPLQHPTMRGGSSLPTLPHAWQPALCLASHSTHPAPWRPPTTRGGFWRASLSALPNALPLPKTLPLHDLAAHPAKNPAPWQPNSSATPPPRPPTMRGGSWRAGWCSTGWRQS